MLLMPHPYWDLILTLTAVIASGLAIRTLDRRHRDSARSRSLPVSLRGATMAGDDPGGAYDPGQGVGRAPQPDHVGSSGWKT